VLKIVAPDAFREFIQELNRRGRQHVKLLKERDVTITAEAEHLMATLEDHETLFLHRKLTRPPKE
jgi:hypothetical protein